jgi:hypothetical protein
MFYYSGTRRELGYSEEQEKDNLVYNLEEKLFEHGLAINPRSNLQRSHVQEALVALYDLSLSN